MNKEIKNFYLVEMSAENASAISAACNSLASICSGKLDIIEAMVCEAYKNRTGKDIDEIMLDQVKNSLKLVQYIGWDSTYGTTSNYHGYSNVSDALFDVCEVLEYQLGQDGIEPHVGSRYPMHWNDRMPLCRIVRKITSAYNRRKQLAIFPK